MRLFFFVLFGLQIGDVKPSLLFFIFLSLFTLNSTSVGRLQNVNKHIIGAPNDLPALPIQNPNILSSFFVFGPPLVLAQGASVR